MRVFLIIIVIIISSLYGVSYEKFRFFSPDDSDGFSDSIGYLDLAEYNFNSEKITSLHNYRIIVPSLVNNITEYISLNNLNLNESSDRIETRLGFYIINFLLILSTCIILYLFLLKIGFEAQYSIIGVLLFITSRVTVYTTGIPLIDSLYYFFLMTFNYSIIFFNTRWSYLLILIYSFGKEVMLSYIFTSLFIKRHRNFVFFITILLSISLFLLIFVITTKLNSKETNDYSFIYLIYDYFQIIYKHFLNIYSNFLNIFSFKGIHDLLHGYTMIFFISIYGIIISLKKNILSREISMFFLSGIFLALLLGLMSGNVGRLFFSSFVPIITFSIIGIREVLENSRSSI